MNKTKMEIKVIHEDDAVEIESYQHLSYHELIEDGETSTEVLVRNKGKILGLFIVWMDSETFREYITVNHTILYLDTLSARDSMDKDTLYEQD